MAEVREETDEEVKLLHRLSKQDYQINQYYWVEITRIIDPHNFYVVPTFYKSFYEIFEKCDGPFTPSSNDCIGQCVVYYSNIEKRRVRGEIKASNKKNLYNIFAPDFGYYETDVHIKKIYKPTSRRIFSPLAVLCELDECAPRDDNFSNEAITGMKKLVKDEAIRIHIRGKSVAGKFKVGMWCGDHSQDVATLMALIKLTYLNWTTTPQPLIEKEDEAHYIFPELVVGQVYHVRIQSGKSLKAFYVGLSDLYSNYCYEGQMFNMYCTYTSAETKSVSIGQAVGIPVAFRKYERGVITKVDENKIKAKLVDVGHTVEITDIQSIVIIRKRTLIQKPVYASFCSISNNSKDWQSITRKTISSGMEFDMKVLTLGNNDDIPHIVEMIPTPTI